MGHFQVLLAVPSQLLGSFQVQEAVPSQLLGSFQVQGQFLPNCWGHSRCRRQFLPNSWGAFQVQEAVPSQPMGNARYRRQFLPNSWGHSTVVAGGSSFPTEWGFCFSVGCCYPISSPTYAILYAAATPSDCTWIYCAVGCCFPDFYAAIYSTFQLCLTTLWCIGCCSSGCQSHLR